MKSLMAPADSAFAATMVCLIACNHFLPERIRLEREALGVAFVEDASAAWNLNFSPDAIHPNVVRLTERTAKIVEHIQRGLKRGGRLSASELAGYESLVNYQLYQRFRKDFRAVTLSGGAASASGIGRLYELFSHNLRTLLEPALGGEIAAAEVALRFAGLVQIERAFVHIFENIVGSSPSITHLRASIWESIFTNNFGRYRAGLYERMHELTTLITGPSGTGKELVARAIGSSGFIPFDPNRLRFTQNFRELFFPINIAALSTQLVESELFGHRRGAFTGALQDHAGWLESCPRGGAVFLDEIGEVSPSLQVKLLRVLQTRTCHRLGENQPRPFHGKIIAATNRNLGTEIRAGHFREDFYYRICSDVIETPSLRQQLSQSPDDLGRLVRFIAGRLVGAELAEQLTAEVEAFVVAKLGVNYGWPGNFRELEQCVRNILVRGRYAPMAWEPMNKVAMMQAKIEAGQLTADELLRWYCRRVYQCSKNLEEAARRLDLDRRTVQAKLDEGSGKNSD